MKTINFGILIQLGCCNSHYLQAYDRLQHDTMKIDVSNYLKTFDRGTYLSNEEMIDDGVKMFADDAKWVKNLDGEGYKSEFFLVCYIADETGVEEIEKIKEIFY